MTGRCHGHRWVRLDDPIFRARHWVFYGPGKTLAKAAAAQRIDLDETPPGAGACAVAQGAGTSTETVVFVNKDAPDEHLETLMHELHHATTYTLLAANLPLVEETTEVSAYYHEWLFREARRGLKL